MNTTQIKTISKARKLTELVQSIADTSTLFIWSEVHWKMKCKIEQTLKDKLKFIV